MNNRYSLYHRHPKGITLIEVMFASGIALFGLLVVVALIPLAGNELRVGLQTDRMAALGRNAVKEFDIRGMRDPSQWTWDRQGSPVLDTRGAETTGANLRWFSGNVKKVPQYRPQPQAYAIDPRFVARNGNAPFPYAPNAKWTMPRISLRMKDPANPLAQGGALSQAAADHLFVARDDLVLLFDDDRSVLSKPNWGLPEKAPDGTPWPAPRKRQY
ncbi:MAG TPA: hypothetical protein EYN70_06670, partial [Planctomycetaceae bacterium]|nr:hypothetical protein [Planctomycetaceae bacterium]